MNGGRKTNSNKDEEGGREGERETDIQPVRDRDGATASDTRCVAPVDPIANGLQKSRGEGLIDLLRNVR